MSEVFTLMATLAPGLAEGLAVIGTTMGITEATASGIPTLAEEPGMRGRVFVLAFLPMTQTLVYGFTYMFLSYFLIIPSILVKYKGIIPPHIAGAILGISLYVGFAELVSAWRQGVVCGQVAAQLIKTRGGIFGSGMILAVYEELFGLLGMVFGIVMALLVAGW
ncbi:MAG: ATPase [Desulfurococcaceae archaeon]|jgi:V/A-type H+-transporting ATPase subunit K|nr:ATPase [Desulfurococcaceae archaeon]